jgi:hypothetical protein
MEQEIWAWAELDDRKLELVKEAERTLGVEYVIAYRKRDAGRATEMPVSMKPAALSASQLECLQGVERLIDSVAVAYGRS